MRATLTTPTFDPAGVVTLDLLPESSIGDTRRRLNRIATLDGGAVFNDFGYAEADRTIELKWAPTSAETEANVDRLVQLYAQLRLSMASGCYLVAPEMYRPEAGESTLTLLVVEKLA